MERAMRRIQLVLVSQVVRSVQLVLEYQTVRKILNSFHTKNIMTQSIEYITGM